MGKAEGGGVGKADGDGDGSGVDGVDGDGSDGDSSGGAGGGIGGGRDGDDGDADSTMHEPSSTVALESKFWANNDMHPYMGYAQQSARCARCVSEPHIVSAPTM